ncbi:MAG: hypothetical protein LWY06_07425 [Firmicutes bacterium]|nr:hypothetical protein [Bacillota bacterium]
MISTYLKAADVFSLTIGIANLILFLISFHKVKKDRFDLLRHSWRRFVFFPFNIILCLAGIAIFTQYIGKYSFILTVFGVYKPLTQYIFSKVFVNFLLFIWFVLVTMSLNTICLAWYEKGIKPLATQGELVMVTSMFSVILSILIQIMLRQLFQLGYSGVLIR